MMTIDKAITKRLEEKRQEREEAITTRKREMELAAGKETEVAAQARAVIRDCYELDLSSVDVKAYLDHEDNDGTGYYEIQLNLTSDQSQMVSTGEDDVIAISGPVIDPESLLAATWTGFHDEDLISTCDDLVEALIYAKYGTTDPDLSETEGA